MLDGNALTELPADLGACTALQTLSIGSNRLTGLPASLGRLQRLRELSASSNLLTDLPAELSQCSSLESVDLSRNACRAVPPALSRLAKLRTLNLDSNPLASVSTDLLLQCQLLQTLCVHDTPITPEVRRPQTCHRTSNTTPAVPCAQTWFCARLATPSGRFHT